MSKRFAFLVLIVLALAAPAAAATVPLLSANFGGYTTTLILENRSAADVPVPHFWDPWGTGAGIPVIHAHDTGRFPGFAKAGLTVAQLEVPAPLIAYVEITTPTGATFPVYPLTLVAAGETWEVLNLRAVGFSSFFILIGASNDAVPVLTRCYAAGTLLYGAESSTFAGSGNATSCDGNTATNRATLSGYDAMLSPYVPPRPFYALALRRSLTTGEWVPLQLTQVAP